MSINAGQGATSAGNGSINIGVQNTEVINIGAPISGMNGSGTENGAAVIFRGGSGGDDSGNGGAVTIQGGAALAGTGNGNGGAVTIAGGAVGTSGVGGNGGAVNITAAPGFGGTNSGGTITISTGAAAGAGDNGGLFFELGGGSTKIAPITYDANRVHFPIKQRHGAGTTEVKNLYTLPAIPNNSSVIIECEYSYADGGNRGVVMMKSGASKGTAAADAESLGLPTIQKFTTGTAPGNPTLTITSNQPVITITKPGYQSFVSGWIRASYTTTATGNATVTSST